MSDSTSPWRRAGGGQASRDGGSDGRQVPAAVSDTSTGENNDGAPIAQLTGPDPNSTPPAAPPRGRQRYTQSVLKKAEEKIRELAGVAETEQHTEAHIDDNLDGAMEQLSAVADLMPLFEPEKMETVRVKLKRRLQAARDAEEAAAEGAAAEEAAAEEEESEPVDANEIPDEGQFDPRAALREYDDEIVAMSQSKDPEEDGMEEADNRRHDRDGEPGPTGNDWNANFETAVHEAGRILFARAFHELDGSIDDAMKMCFSADEAQTKGILAEFDVPDWFNISYKHVMGEALELMMCYLSRVEKRQDMRDYLAERREGVEEDSPIFVKCEVHKCFMSAAPAGSPFRMKEEDKNELAAAFGGTEDAWRLANRLYDQAQRDRFFDVLVVLKDLDASHPRHHIRAIQCKARSDFNSYINIARYVGHAAAVRDMADKVDALICLDWVANVYACKQAEVGGDFADQHNTGLLRTFLYEDMCRQEASIRLAAEMAKHPFNSRMGEEVPTRPRQRLRECQTAALDKLRCEREKGSNGGSVVAATGSGKSLIAFTDAMRTLYTESGDSLTPLDQIAMVWACPRILLLEQSAEGFKAHEDRELAEFANRAKEQGTNFETPKLFYYLVCSKSETFDTPNPNAIRRLNAPQLFNTLLKHRSRGDELSRCRFFTTVEGGSSFWYQLTKFIRVSRGLDEPLNNRENPLVNVFIIDEAHEVAGNSAGSYQLTLNIPAKWRVCYSATPFVELQRGENLRARDGDDAESDGTAEEPAEGQSVGEKTPEERFPDVYFKKLADLNSSDENESDAGDPADNNVDHIGLSRVQLLSESLQFMPLERAASLPQFQSEDERELIRQLQDVARSLGSEGPSVDNISQALGGRQVVIFATRRDRYRGMCTCQNAAGEECMAHCASRMFPQETAVGERYKCNFDFWQKNFIAWDTPVEEMLMPDCVVLGWDKETKVLSIRSDEARGFGCHDFTDFGVQNGSNLIGTPIFSYTFAEAFRSPDNILAKPFLLTYRLKVPDMSSMNDDRHDRLKCIFGIKERTGRRGRIVTGDPLNKVGLQISFDDVTDSPIAATAQDYATAMTIYRMIERGEASKIMVFCWRNEDCRRCLALFNLLLKQRISEASHNRELADRLREVQTAHIFATWQRNERTDEMEEHVKKRLLHQFKTGKIEVLFNANYLSTGIDIPCTDAVVLTQKSKGVRQVLQRWGRALRSIATQPSKRGILAIIMSDPEEPDEDKDKRKEFMGFDLALPDDFGGCHADFCNMYRTAECAAHRSNRIIGECDKIKAVPTTVKRKAHRDAPDKKKTTPTFPPPVATITPDVERTLRDMFDITVRNLLEDVDSQPSQRSLEHQDSDLVGSLASMGIEDERDGSQSESEGDSEHRSLADIQRDRQISGANDGSAPDADATIERRAEARRPPRADRLTESAPEERAMPAPPRGQTTRPGAPQGTSAAGGGDGGNGGRFKARSPTMPGHYRKTPAGAQPAAESTRDSLAEPFDVAPVPPPRNRASDEITPAPAPPATATVADGGSVGPREGERPGPAGGEAGGSGPQKVSIFDLPFFWGKKQRDA